MIPRPFKKNKYNARKSACLSKHIHHSRAEADYCNVLMADLKSGRIIEYHTQYKFPLTVNGHVIANHFVDFYVLDKSGKWRVDEVKGMQTGEWIIKRKLFESIFHEIPYNVIKR